MPPHNGDWNTVKMHHWDDEAKISILETEKGKCMVLHVIATGCVQNSCSHVTDMYMWNMSVLCGN